MRAALGPEPVLTTWWVHPASVTPAKHQRPSLTTEQLGSRLRLANPAIDRGGKAGSAEAAPGHRLLCRLGMLRSIDPLYSLSGFFVGLLVGQTGMGGGALMTPLLVLLFGINPATAVGTDLLYASATKTVGTLVHGLNHTVQWRIVTLLAMGSVPATALTLLVISKLDLSSSVTSSIIGTVLGVLLLLTSLSLFFRRQFLASTGTRLLAIRPKQTTLLTVTTGAVLGVLVTISSVGAGALGVTSLLLLYPRLPMAIIVGSDIAHAVPLTAANSGDNALGGRREADLIARATLRIS